MLSIKVAVVGVILVGLEIRGIHAFENIVGPIYVIACFLVSIII